MELKPGIKLCNDYKLIEPIGHGGMGAIWRAKDLPGKREVALKFVPRDVQNFESEMDRAEDVIIDCPTSNAFLIFGGNPSFQNLTASSGAELYCGFKVTGGTPKLFRCTITSRKGSGMVVQGKEANPQVESCVMKDCGGTGMFVLENGLGEFKDCEIYGNAKSGIQVETSGNPTVTGCEILFGKCYGVWVHDKGMGTFNNNTLTANYWDGKLSNWVIRADAGAVKGTGNTPSIPWRWRFYH